MDSWLIFQHHHCKRWGDVVVNASELIVSREDLRNAVGKSAAPSSRDRTWTPYGVSKLWEQRPGKASKHIAVVTVLKLTQVGRANSPRRSEEPSERNSAN